ncbi:type II toxin-antitoxin system RelE/ParE family toxin [Streptococcus merionis]|uniref:type II toxin-antitoxin system RelE/ParE family toxin n=1 Tax=Streptococcus merionis TaxID=400065 RepID=UPI0035136447
MIYTVNVPRQVLRDIQEAAFYKQKLGTYQENIEHFITKLDIIIYDKLSKSPKIGSNLSSRLTTSSDAKYQIIDDYTLFYEISEEDKEVDVLRLLPAKSNWMTTILKEL